jgi:putative transposase
MLRSIAFLVTLLVRLVRALFRPRAELVLENLALRQQVTALKHARPRPTLDDVDRAFWVALRAAWNGWADRLVLVKPETVVKWHRERFRRHWAQISRRRRPGRPRVAREIRQLVRTMALDNRGWGAPRIHGELLKLGIVVSEATVSRYMPRRRAEPDKVQRWITFLRNHQDVIAAMDFFTVPTVRLRVLYGFVVLDHGRRRVLHVAATFNATAAWTIQQLREAFSYDTAPRYLLFDRDSIFSRAVVKFVEAMGTKPVRTAYRSPWQNPFVERWIGSCRRELLDHVVPFNEGHLLRLVREYVAYYHHDRTHLGLEKDAPITRSVTARPSSRAPVVALPRVGGLHCRYRWRQAA